MSIRGDAVKLLMVCEIPPKLHGFAYLVDAIEMAYIDESLLKNLEKGLYIEIGERWDVSAASVERSIRAALKSCKTKHTNQGFITAAVWCLKFLYRRQQTAAPIGAAKIMLKSC